jgi:hypothetical protein
MDRTTEFGISIHHHNSRMSMDASGLVGADVETGKGGIFDPLNLAGKVSEERLGW